ncbi:MAG: VWA domain-containing protein [Algisphaera sp.]
MSFLNPINALIAAGVTLPLLVSLYFLKLRRKTMAVPSTLLWKKSIQDLQVNAPFQRIRNNLLLWLQLALLALLLVVWARPTQEAQVVAGDRVVLLVDRSASMNATDGPGGIARLEAAKAAALEVVEGLANDGVAGAMVVTFAQRAAVVQSFTNDVDLLRRAIADIRPSDQRSRIEPALAVAEQWVTAGDGDSGNEGNVLSVYVMSDGKVQREGAQEPALPGATLNFVKLGRSDTANVGIVQASARRDVDDPTKVQVFAALQNSGPDPLTVNLTLLRDGQVQRTRAVVVPAAMAGGEAGQVGETFALRVNGGAMVEVFHDRPDALESDDRVRLAVLPARQLRVLLVSPGGASQTYLREALVAAGAREVQVMAPDVFERMSPDAIRDGGDGAGEGYGVLVFDRYAPLEEPRVASLSFGAAPPVAGLEVVPAAADSEASSQGLQSVLTWKRDHPVMAYVALDDVTLSKPGRLVVPASAQVLAMGVAGPLMAQVYGAQGLRHVVVSFDVLESRWPHHWSFQVFMVNALETLGLSEQVGAGEASLAYRTGESATVPVSGEGGVVRYQGQGRAAGVAVAGSPRQGRAALAGFEKVGRYDAAAESRTRVASPYDQLVVNLLDPLESDLRSAETLAVSSGAPVASMAAAGVARHEVWPWFAWGALGLLALEWWVYTRRMRV